MSFWIARDLDDFCDGDRRQLIKQLRDFLGTNEFAVIEFARGSIKVRIMMDLETAQQLLVAAGDGTLEDLGITSAKELSKEAAEAIVVLRKHEEAGTLLRQLEAWLHRPDGERDVDVAKFLTPYKDLPAEELSLTPQLAGEVT